MNASESAVKSAETAVPYGSNAVRLSGRAWVVVAVVVVALFLLIP